MGDIIASALGVASPLRSKLARTVRLLVAAQLGARCKMLKGVEEVGVAAAEAAAELRWEWGEHAAGTNLCDNSSMRMLAAASCASRLLQRRASARRAAHSSSRKRTQSRITTEAAASGAAGCW